VGRGNVYLEIQVVLDITYKINFKYTPVGARSYDPPQCNCISDIKYIPISIIEMIKLIQINENDSGSDRIMNSLSSILKETLQKDIQSEISNKLEKTIFNLKQELGKNKHELNNTKKMNEDLIENVKKDSIIELQKAYKSFGTSNKRLNEENKAFETTNKSLNEENKRLNEENKAFETTNKRLNEENKRLDEENKTMFEKKNRLLENVNNEKLKYLNLNAKFGDLTDLYENLLNTTY
jgi:chromosome segregation ATPase